MREKIDTISTVARPGFNALLEDVFGLNVRGLRTLKDLYVQPKRVFDNARMVDWANQHTPTIRLTFSLITVYMLLSFFWAAEDGPFYQTLYSQLEANRAANPDLPPVEEMVDRWFAAYSLTYPFFYMLTHGLIGLVVPIWGKGVSWTTRLRMYFGLCAMGMSVALFVTLLMPVLNASILPIFFLFALLAGLLVYGLTYWRAMRGTFSLAALAWRAPFMAIFITFVDILVGFLTTFGSGFWVGHQS